MSRLVTRAEMLEYALSQLPPGSEVHEVARVGDDVTWYLETSDGPAWVVTSDAICASTPPSATRAQRRPTRHMPRTQRIIAKKLGR